MRLFRTLAFPLSEIFTSALQQMIINNVPRNILTILKVSSFLCVLATKMVYATNGTHLRHVHTEKPVTLTLTLILTHNPNP
jgi:hypothetical protein